MITKYFSVYVIEYKIAITLLEVRVIDTVNVEVCI